MYRHKIIHIFIPVLFLVFFVNLQQSHAQESVSPVPTFTSIGDCTANNSCPTPEQGVGGQPVDQQPVEQQPVDQQPVEQQPVDQQPINQPQDQQETQPRTSQPNNNQLISIIQQLIELLKQLLGGGGCPDTGSQVSSNYVENSNYTEDAMISAYHRGKKKWKNKKKGLLKRIKCGGQQGGGEQDGGQQGGGQQDGGQQGGGQQDGGQQGGGQQDGGQQGGGQQDGGQQGGGQQDGGQQGGGDPQPEPTNPPEPTVAPTRAASPTTAAGGGNLGACTGGPQATEPAHNYTRTTHGGRTVNIRTRDMLRIAEGFFGSPFTLSQGSYSTGVAASAGTHDGGGVVDISVNSMSAAQRNEAIRALRMAGFTAWLRSPAEGFAYHIHANAIGDREMSPVARSQVTSFFNGRNGLAGNGPDTAPASVGRPLPSWASAYGTCR